jgi:hypothetical protein
LGKLAEKQLELGLGRGIEAELVEERGSETFRFWENLLLQINKVGMNAAVQLPVEEMDTAKELLEDFWQRLEEEIVESVSLYLKCSSIAHASFVGSRGWSIRRGGRAAGKSRGSRRREDRRARARGRGLDRRSR